MNGLMSDEFMSALLSPLSESSPSGVYLKSRQSVYRPLRNALNIAQSSLQELSFNPDPKELDSLIKRNKENWAQLESLLIDALINHSRDLELLAWLAMAQLFTGQPYVRLARVLHLNVQVIVTFWPELQPWLPGEKLKSTNDDDIFQERIKWLIHPFNILFGDSEASCQIAVPLRMLPLVEGVDYVYYLQHELGLGVEDQALRTEIFNEKSELVSRIKAMANVVKALDELDSTLQQYFAPVGVQVPASRFFRAQLEANLIAMKNLTAGIIVPWPLDSAENDAVKTTKNAQSSNPADPDSLVVDSLSQENSSQPASAPCQSGEVRNESIIYDRDSAFRQLHKIARYFLTNEPQSPVSYLLERAIRWGYTPLPELMKELLEGNENAMARISGMMCIGEGGEATTASQTEVVHASEWVNNQSSAEEHQSVTSSSQAESKDETCYISNLDDL